ncbi:MAG: cupin domain-containing protein [Deltaproteobacteria bacterium]|jgi:uncharacterized cupin superfamily protein|nr:cupin domain-containing protein [Deltaproteobacteria bacterium]MBW2499004.1 cupin domain-containing protein [Deltaproteobacteria bacterium]
MEKPTRLVVTGRNEAGRSVVVSDSEPSFVETADGSECAELWSLPVGPIHPESGRVPSPGDIGHEPLPGASAWRVVRLFPRAAAVEAVQQRDDPGARVDHDRVGLHRNETLDWITILSGEVDLVLDRETLRLRPGDCLVQCGAAHAWRVVGEQDCVLGVLMLRPTSASRGGPKQADPIRQGSDQGVGPRRVVTKQDAQGRSFVAQDGEPPNVLRLKYGTGMAYSDIWQTLGPVGSTDAGGDTPAGPFEFYAVGGGAAWKHMVIPPDAALAGVNAERLAAEYAERAPGMAEGGDHDPDRPGRHRTESIDLVQILSGHITLMLDEGEVDLAPGDFVVQRGTWHAWSNRGEEPCIFQAMMIATRPLPA